jgi:hypothetical protein
MFGFNHLFFNLIFYLATLVEKQFTRLSNLITLLLDYFIHLPFNKLKPFRPKMIKALSTTSRGRLQSSTSSFYKYFAPLEQKPVLIKTAFQNRSVE